MDRFCLECSAMLKGRADKKFCDDQCRSGYNYRLKASDQRFINVVNQILKNNRRILKATNPSSKKKVKREDLLMKGFDFQHHTFSYQTTHNETYFYCYEYGYQILANDEVLLVQRDGKEEDL